VNESQMSFQRYCGIYLSHNRIELRVLCFLHFVILSSRVLGSGFFLRP